MIVGASLGVKACVRDGVTVGVTVCVRDGVTEGVTVGVNARERIDAAVAGPT